MGKEKWFNGTPGYPRTLGKHHRTPRRKWMRAGTEEPVKGVQGEVNTEGGEEEEERQS